MERTYTIETRIRVTPEIREYLSGYVTAYNKLYRIMWHQMSSTEFKLKYPKESYYITYICKQYNVLKRTANTIYKSILGKQKALLELNKTELRNLKNKTENLTETVTQLKDKINRLKPKVTANKATAKELERYRSYKNKLYQKQRKLNRFKQRIDTLEYMVNNKVYSVCFGSEKLYKAQWNLKKNGYKTHIKWLNYFRKARDKNIEYLGASGETSGNQMCQIRYNSITKDFSLQIRKEPELVNGADRSKYLCIDNLSFKYMQEELKLAVPGYTETKQPKPLTYRFKRKDNKWYIQVVFAVERTPVTRYTNGVIGLDFNNGFIEATETDSKGNMEKQYHYRLKYHGCGNKAKSEMSETVARIVNTAVTAGKDITIESLDFRKKKSTTATNRSYNKMLHTLDYSRYTDMLRNACHRKQVNLIQVNPSYTSIVGELKYGNSRKLNRHQAASYVIARLGQGYTDSYNSYKTVI